MSHPPRPLPASSCAPLLSLALTAALLAACGEDKDPLDSQTGNSMSGTSGTDGMSSADPSGDPGGDPTDGATDTGASGSHGDCDAYLACLAAVMPGSVEGAEMAYGDASPCWTSTPDVKQACLDACTGGLEALGSAYPDEPACGGTGSTTGSPTSDPTGDPTGSPTSDPTGDPTSDATSEPGTSDPFTTTDPFTTGRTSETSTSDTGDTDGGYGTCGWDATNKYYACLGMPGAPDPDGISPIDCPANPQEGGPCTDDGPISAIGCCTSEAENFYCSGGVVVRETCGF